MDPSAHEARIAELEAEIEAVRQELEPLCQAFLAATHRFVAGWFQRHVEHVVLGKADVTKTLSRDALRSLKADLKKLVEQAPELVTAHLGREQYWLHRRPLLNDSTTLLNLQLNPYEPRPGHPPGALNSGIQAVLAVADNMLERYGFHVPARAAEPMAPAPKRTFAFEWTEEMVRTLAVYATRFERLKWLNSEVLPLRRRRGEADARRLWDQA